MGTSSNITGVTIDKCAAWLHGAEGDVGVLLCGPIGLGDLCLRRAWRMLATLCAEAGYPALRFDYPGCGDSLGDLADVKRLEALAHAATAAASALRRRARVERLVLVGHGLGAAIAALAAQRIGAEALALLAPPASGRAHLRELELWGRWVSEGLGLDPDDPQADAGYRLPAPFAASLAALDLMTLAGAPAKRIFLAAPPDHGAGSALARMLGELGAEVETAPYREHAAALEAPTNARPPLALFETLMAWLQRTVPPGLRTAVPPPLEPARLVGEGFSDALVRFGPGGRLAGVLCEPRSARTGVTALLLNAGGDPHVGWGRSSVRHARALAQQGVASLRIDLGDLGDSSGPPGADAPCVFHPSHVEDARLAIDWLETAGLTPVMAVGRCSGASIAFSTAARDARVTNLVLVNLPDAAADVDDLKAEPMRRLDYYLARARAPGVLLARALRGEIDIATVLARLGRVALGLGPALLGPDRADRASRAALQRLSDRGARIAAVCSAGDEADFTLRLAEANNAEVFRLGADSAFSSPTAHAALLDILLDQAMKTEPLATPADPPAIRPPLARPDPLLGASA
jgi:pimeloyl-ACP methyl ester carboxylesterase